jgi:hypothetical protein
MAINFKDGVILGADSRTTTGAYIANRVTDKLTRVSETIWCCRSGSAADTQAVADIVQYHLSMYETTNNQPPSTQTAAAIFQELCYDNKDQLRYVWFIVQGWLVASTNIRQRRHHHRRLRPQTWRSSLLATPRWLTTQATIRNWRLRLNIHLRLLRCELEGEYD